MPSIWDHITLGNVISIFTFFITGIGAVIAVTRTIDKNNENLRKELSKDLEQLGRDLEQKRARIYERIDEVKKDMELRYVRRDLCDVLHTQTEKLIAKIETKIDLIANELRNFFTKEK